MFDHFVKLTLKGLVLSKLESLSTDQLVERLNCLVNEEKFKNKPPNPVDTRRRFKVYKTSIRRRVSTGNGKNSYYLETNRANLFFFIETSIQHGPPTTPNETVESTLPTEETPLPRKLITTPMLNNLQ